MRFDEIFERCFKIGEDGQLEYVISWNNAIYNMRAAEKAALTARFAALGIGEKAADDRLWWAVESFWLDHGKDRQIRSGRGFVRDIEGGYRFTVSEGAHRVMREASAREKLNS